ncbi:MAG: aminomethyl-transferring glycine dehydrogenase [Gemmatimonadetes bacterium]|nr:aminomethyl-transferring glycine dehydrogenase [Gemmatimonadota bacterium]
MTDDQKHISERHDQFAGRHIGPRKTDIERMLHFLNHGSLESLIDAVVPEDIRLNGVLQLDCARSEDSTLEILRQIASRNKIFKSYIGMGYSDCVTPTVILRNILENPGWYTAYTPYQAEISQGRLEALLTFQTMVSDLTGLAIANASLLDEGTAAAEAMAMSCSIARKVSDPVYLVDSGAHPQTIAIVETRARARGIPVVVQDPSHFEFGGSVVGALVQYPATDGALRDFSQLCQTAHDAGALVTAATDLLSLTLLTPPGEWGADIAVGNSQRFGVPMGYGGPHAAFFATREKYKRNIPGRIIGVSRDAAGNPGLRMALQTREQHIRRDKATSNICTAQVLLAVIAAMYAVYHGSEGLRMIARRVHSLTQMLAAGLSRLKFEIVHSHFFDTLCVEAPADTIAAVHREAASREINLRKLSATQLTISLDETTRPADVEDLLSAFALGDNVPFTSKDLRDDADGIPPIEFKRGSEFLTHPVFHRYRSETEMLRYLKRLENKDLSLTTAMIPLGSCTLKLNSATEMIPVTWPEFARLHPFAPQDQAEGYSELFQRLERQLQAITGFSKISLQPNAGSQGEFAGLLVIRAFHDANGGGARDVCLIPQSAHGTNPASAVMAGMKVVTVKTDSSGNIDLEDLKKKAHNYRESLAAFMVTYPSTHGVFEGSIREICDTIHDNGGQVYMDGANLNAQMGLCRPADIGADVCHLNLHKTFSIPHGGGGPGMGPIGVKSHLEPYLPSHPVIVVGDQASCGTISAAPWGSASILPISWAYIEMMGREGLLDATRVAILNANYVARKLDDAQLPLLYYGKNGLVAHECIIDTREFKSSAGIEVEDIAKRLIDYGFHPPTVSFPVPGTLMIEPTESESLEELDRFCDAMAQIRQEIKEIEMGVADRESNVLKNAPHTLETIMSGDWDLPYTRKRAAFPMPDTHEHKVWPSVGRIDGAYGDRNFVCICPPVEAYESEHVGV